MHGIRLALPAPGSAHLWLCDSDAIRDPELLDAYRALLDEPELVRMQRRVFARDRHRFLVAHALLRSVLSLYADVPATAWRFEAGAHGKPALAPAAALPDLDFNLSHSGSHALLAVSTGCMFTGVDLEFHRPARNFHGLAQRNFAQSEAARLIGLEETGLAAEFYDIWTLKEAFVKATGEGLSRSLGDFWFDFRRAEGYLSFGAKVELEPQPASWNFWCHRLQTSYSAALALRGPDADMDTDTDTDTDEPCWFGIVPQLRWHALDVPCLMRSRRITGNRASGSRMH